jgi:hypothetical protein
MSQKSEYLKNWMHQHPGKAHEYYIRYKAKHPERYAINTRKAARKYIAKLTPEEKAQRSKIAAEKHKLYRQDWRLKKKYGISLTDWHNLFTRQENKCAACQTTDPGSKLGWHTDHDHNTGKLRGILCHHCNTILGRIKDNPTPLYALANYLERNAQHE